MNVKLIAALGCVAAAAAIAATAGQDPAPAPWTAQRVGQMFRSSCASCHVAPDATFATDRDWIAQVLGTT